MVIHWIFLTSLSLLASANRVDANDNATLPDVRHPRVTGRIVKLYSGSRPEPVYCSTEGFQADPVDCTVFYRCVKANNGKYNVFRFQCGPGTIFDPDTEVCNHPQSTKRSQCGGSNHLTVPTETQSNQPNDENEIEEHQSELPTPIRRPEISDHTTQRANTQTKGSTSYPWPTATSQQQSPNKPNPGQSNSKHFPLCTTDGFMGDTENCRTFYRCVSNARGGYIRYEFQCSEATVWDDDAQSCNHAWAVQRSRCGRSNADHIFDKTFTLYPPTKTTKKDEQSTTISSSPITPEPSTTTAGGSATQEPTATSSSASAIQETTTLSSSNPTIQEQLQINYGSKVSQTQTQISNGPAIQNQTQINYGDRKNKQDVKQNQTQISKGSAISQTQTQINYGDKAVQTQSQIDHTQQASQTQTSQTQSGTTNNPSTADEDSEPDNGYNNPPGSSQPNSESTNSNSNMGTQCNESGFMGDPNDCRKFYRCVDNGKGSYTKYEFTCGEGTVWDGSIEGCNHKWAVKNCGGKGPSQPSHQGSGQTTTQAPKSTTTQKPTEKPVTESITTEENEDTGYGNQNPQPSHPPTTTAQPNQQHTTTESSTSNGNIGTECTSSGFVGDDQDCKKFYRCVDDGKNSYTKYEFKCGEGTVWDPDIEACNHAWAVKKCGGSSTDVNKVETTTAKQTTVGSTVVSTTTQGPTTTQNIDTDDDQGYGQPNNEPAQPTSSSTTTTTKKPHSSSSENSKCKQSGFMGDENDCRKFYRCVDDGKGGYIRYEFTCGEGTAWDQSIEGCNHEELVEKCGSSGSSPPGTNTQGETTTASPHESTTETVTKSTTQSTQTATSQTTVQQQEPTKKPAPSKDCTQEGFMGDPNDCKKFYRCVDNGKGGFIKYEFSCGQGTVWDSEIDSCNHPSSNHKCGSSGDTNENVPPSNVESDEMVTDEGTTTTTTAPTLTTSPTPTTTTLASSPTSASSSQSTGQEKPKPESTGQCESEGFHANPDDCRKFYRCVANDKGGYTKYDFSCGEGTVWVQDIQACDHDSDPSSCNKPSDSTTKSPSIQEEATTESSSSSTSSSPTTSSSSTAKPDKGDGHTTDSQSSSSSTEECTSEGFYGNKKECKKFYRCVDDGKGGFTKYDFDCGEGTAWDADIQSCNHINAVQSCPASQQSSSKPDQEQDPSKPNQEQDQSKPNQEQDQTKPIMQDEQPSQSTDSTTSSPSDGSSSSTEGSQQPQSSSKATCDEEGYFGDPDDCKKFYRCVDNGKGGYTKYDFDCGEGTIWDQDLTTCNHPQDVQNPSCKESQSGSSSPEGSSTTSSSTTSSSKPQTTSSTTESSSSGSSNCSQENSSKKPDNKGYDCPQAGYYADPNDCKKFYRCVDWEGDGKKYSIYHFDCGEGTIWDPALDTCNHEESVYPPRDCSGSQSQGENVTQENTTEMSTTPEDTSTQPSTTEQSTTESTTPEESTTEQQTTSQQTTTKQTTTSEKTTTEQTTTEQTTSKPTTTEQTTTQESTTKDQTEATTTQQSTTQESTTQEQTEGTTTQQTTTQESTTQEQTEATTTQQTTTPEQTEATTTQQTTTQESTTQEQTEATTAQQTTTEQTTTQEQTEQTTTQQTTEQTTQESTTEQSTTESSTQESTTSQNSESTQQTTTESGNTENTTESSSPGDTECPETEDDQDLYVCPTSFRRHPKYCNMFYQCTEDDDTHEVKIATFNCPNNTIYDENQTKCVDEDKTEQKCDGEMAQKRRFKRLDAYYREPIVVTTERLKCPASGHYPFEKEECSPAFLKCQKSKSGSMRGQVYRCPESHIYWAVSRRCEARSNMRDCKNSVNIWNDRWEIPIERRNVAPKVLISTYAKKINTKERKTIK